MAIGGRIVSGPQVKSRHHGTEQAAGRNTTYLRSTELGSDTLSLMTGKFVEPPSFIYQGLVALVDTPIQYYLFGSGIRLTT